MLYQEAIDQLLIDHTVGQPKTGDLSGIWGYDIYYNKTNYELAHSVQYIDDKVIVVIMAGTREKFLSGIKEVYQWIKKEPVIRLALNTQKYLIKN